MLDPTNDPQSQSEHLEAALNAELAARVKNILGQNAITATMAVEEKPTLFQQARSKVRAMPAEKACKPIMTILSSLTLLAVAFLILTTSVRGITDIIIGHLHEAKDNLAALQGQTDYEVRMRYKLDWLTGTELPGRIWETHTDCLVRGIHYVDAFFLGGDFYVSHTDVTKTTIDWVKDNCDRLAFTPQVVTPVKEFSLSRGWGFVNHHIASFLGIVKIKVLHPMVEPMKLSIGAFLGHTFSEQQQSYQNRAPGATTESNGGRTAVIDRGWTLPRHFRLIDCEDQPCKLVYEPPENNLSASTSTEEALTRIEGRITALYIVAMTFWRTYVVIDYLWRMTLVFQCLLMVTLIAIECTRPEAECISFSFFQARQWLSRFPKFEEHDKRLWISIAIETVLLVSIQYVSCVYDGLTPDLYVGSLIVGCLLLVLWLTTWGESVPNIAQIFYAFKELSSVTQAAAAEASVSSGALNGPPSPISTSLSLPTNADGRVSSITSLLEDLDTIRTEEKSKQMAQSMLDELAKDEDPSKVIQTVVEFNESNKYCGTEEIDFKSVSDMGSDWSDVSIMSAQVTDG